MPARAFLRGYGQHVKQLASGGTRSTAAMPNALLDFANDPDQMSREAELRDFVGPNAEKFLAAYRKMRPGPDGKTRFRIFGEGFCWPAFFLGPIWFFYRKMWAVAWGIVGLLVVTNVLGILAPSLPIQRIGFPVAVIIGGWAFRLYVTQAASRLNTMRTANGGVLRPETVRQAGGVSVTAAWVSGIVYGLVVLLGIIGLVYAAQHGQRV